MTMPEPALPLSRLSDIERAAIHAALQATQGNVRQAADILGVAPSTIYRKLQGWETRS